MARPLSQKIYDALPLSVPFSGVCFRNVSQQFARQHTILSAHGSLLAGGRYNSIGLFEVLYLSCDVHTCLEETTRSFQQGGREVAKSLPRTIIGIEVSLARVLDLTDNAMRRRLGLALSVLLAPGWRRTQDVDNREAPTQELGRLARDVGFEALLVPSAANRSGRNLNAFPDRLLPTSSLTPVNPSRLPPV